MEKVIQEKIPSGGFFFFCKGFFFWRVNELTGTPQLSPVGLSYHLLVVIRHGLGGKKDGRRGFFPSFCKNERNPRAPSQPVGPKGGGKIWVWGMERLWKSWKLERRLLVWGVGGGGVGSTWGGRKGRKTKYETKSLFIYLFSRFNYSPLRQPMEGGWYETNFSKHKKSWVRRRVGDGPGGGAGDGGLLPCKKSTILCYSSLFSSLKQ